MIVLRFSRDLSTFSWNINIIIYSQSQCSLEILWNTILSLLPLSHYLSSVSFFPHTRFSLLLVVVFSSFPVSSFCRFQVFSVSRSGVSSKTMSMMEAWLQRKGRKFPYTFTRRYFRLDPEARTLSYGVNPDVVKYKFQLTPACSVRFLERGENYSHHSLTWNNTYTGTTSKQQCKIFTMFYSDLLEQQQALPSAYRCGQRSEHKMGESDREVHCTETLSQTWYNQRLRAWRIEFRCQIKRNKG